MNMQLGSMNMQLGHEDEGTQSIPRWQARVETTALTALSVAIAAAASGAELFSARHGFPWLCVAPLLAGLRYGARQGVASACLQLLALVIACSRGWSFAPPSAAELALGWLLVGLVSGQFRDRWARRRRVLEDRADEILTQYEKLARAYHALRASHDRLQRDIPGGVSTLRDALEAVKSALAGRRGEPLEAVADPVLAVFRDQASLRAATLHPVGADGNVEAAVASLGPAGDDPADDPLVREAARAGAVMSVRDASERTGILAAVPLTDVKGRVHGIVAVHDLPFIALQEDTLALLAVIGGHVGDLLSPALQAPNAREARPRERIQAVRAGAGSSDGESHGRLVA
jgi:hypothetical protein